MSGLRTERHGPASLLRSIYESKLEARGTACSRYWPHRDRHDQEHPSPSYSCGRRRSQPEKADVRVLIVWVGIPMLVVAGIVWLWKIARS